MSNRKTFMDRFNEIHQELLKLVKEIGWAEFVEDKPNYLGARISGISDEMQLLSIQDSLFQEIDEKFELRKKYEGKILRNGKWQTYEEYMENLHKRQ